MALMSPLPKHRAPAGTQALQRAIGLLKTFTTANPKLTLAELHAATGLTKPTAHRLLSALESEGFVERTTPPGTFRLGPALVALGSQALETSDLRAEIRPTLEQLARTTGETTTLEVLVDDSMLILDSVKGSHLLGGSLEIGTRWPVHATSTGKCWLASMPDSLLELALDSTLESFTTKTLIEANELRPDLERIRARGYGTGIEELEPDYVAVAASFNDSFGNIEGAISVGGPASRFGPARIEELGEILRKAANRLSARHRARG